MNKILAAAFLVLLCLGVETAWCGQKARAKAKTTSAPEPENPLEAMTVEQLRAFQSYFYSSGGRDPMLMRFPTDREKGQSRKSGPRKAPTLEEQEALLEGWLKSIKEAIGRQDYNAAIRIANEAVNVIDNEWPPIKSEYKKLVRMNEDIRSYARTALRLKTHQEITREFIALRLRVDGVIWSPTDAKAIVNGKLLSAGEALLDQRKDGDLRAETIEEHGVVFQFKGLRFRLPVELQAPMGATSVEGLEKLMKEGEGEKDKK